MSEFAAIDTFFWQTFTGDALLKERLTAQQVALGYAPNGLAFYHDTAPRSAPYPFVSWSFISALANHGHRWVGCCYLNGANCAWTYLRFSVAVWTRAGNSESISSIFSRFDDLLMIKSEVRNEHGVIIDCFRKSPYERVITEVGQVYHTLGGFWDIRVSGRD
ncbi:MAG TPA: hypothetical protein VJX74_16160 [Blastocatellia bacterium]|nr:hypothetical protein [Blastocatellia bacterium]